MNPAAQIAALPPHDLDDRQTLVRQAMKTAGLDRLIVASSGLHMIDLPNPVLQLCGLRSVGPCFVSIESDGSMRALGSPSDDGERLSRWFPNCSSATDDVAGDVEDFVRGAGKVGYVGFGLLPFRIAERARSGLGASASTFDRWFYEATAIKTSAEISAAAEATKIAEAGYLRLLGAARPGCRECDLAVDVNLHMRDLGADDSFLMLNAGPRSDAVMPSSERVLEAGDLILSELSPCVGGQFVQICRTAAIGEPTAEALDAYALLSAALNQGIATVKPGVRMSEVCAAIDDHLSEAGFAEFSRPPFIRRRGHGLGAGSVYPGDVGVDNKTVLVPGMLFVVHPNQFLPAAGYMMCGEPLVVGLDQAIVLSTRRASLDRAEVA